MTINKEQAVSDAMRAQAREIVSRHCEYTDGLNRGQIMMKTSNAIAAVVEALAMKAASHPLEQQQAVSGDVVERAIHNLVGAARMYEASCRLGGKDQEFASRQLDEARRAALAASGVGRMREALERAIETLAASRHLIGKYTPEHHWLGEHDQRIAELRTALQGGE